MSDPFAGAVEACFRHLGVDGAYTPQGGSDTTVRVVFTQPTEVAGLLDTGLAAPARSAEVLAKEVSGPAAGDRLSVGSTTFVVRQARRDPLGLVWRLDLDPQ